MGWQNALRSIRQFSLPRTHALTEQLNAARVEHAAVSAELDTVRDEFVQAHNNATQQIDALQSQLSRIESDRDRERQHARLLEESLRAERAVAAAELETLGNEVARAHISDQQQIGALQSQLDRMESSRDSERKQTKLLEESLQQAIYRQAGTEQRLASLETQLEEARQQHATDLTLTRNALTHLQSEQHGLLSQQSDLMHKFDNASHELLQTLQAQTKPRTSMLQFSAFASLLFLSGALAAALMLTGSRDARLDITAFNSRAEELQLMMKAQVQRHDQLVELLTQLVELRALRNPVPGQGAAPPGEDAGVAAGALPPVETDTSDNLTSRRTDTSSANLRTLGFDVAAHRDNSSDEQAAAESLQRFRQLYRLEAQPDAVVDAALQVYADTARADAQKYAIDGTVLAAIRLASSRTGVEFSYLMELAAVESGFDPKATAGTSTASGLYQFKDESWLDAIFEYGDKYGLGHYASQVHYRGDDNGSKKPLIEDADLHQRVLDLRFDPHLAALLAAEQVLNGRERLANTLERQPDRTELYLTHFLGTSGAIRFLKALAENPNRIAGDIFPDPARRNRGVFQASNRTPRTLTEIYRVLSAKFNTARYGES